MVTYPQKDRPCERHKQKILGYIQWHNWADKQIRMGVLQRQCPMCGFYLFPSEI